MLKILKINLAKPKKSGVRVGGDSRAGRDRNEVDGDKVNGDEVGDNEIEKKV